MAKRKTKKQKERFTHSTGDGAPVNTVTLYDEALAKKNIVRSLIVAGVVLIIELIIWQVVSRGTL